MEQELQTIQYGISRKIFDCVVKRQNSKNLLKEK